MRAVIPHVPHGLLLTSNCTSFADRALQCVIDSSACVTAADNTGPTVCQQPLPKVGCWPAASSTTFTNSDGSRQGIACWLEQRIYCNTSRIANLTREVPAASECCWPTADPTTLSGLQQSQPLNPCLCNSSRVPYTVVPATSHTTLHDEQDLLASRCPH